MHIHRRTADVAGHTRRFIVIEPEELGPQPDLLLFFHGSHQSANVIRRFTNGTVDALADATNTLVVYPDGIGHHFNDTRADLPVRARELGVDDVAFSTFLIETMQREYSTARTFAAGYSNGGQMVLRLLYDAPLYPHPCLRLRLHAGRGFQPRAHPPRWLPAYPAAFYPRHRRPDCAL